MDTFANWDTYKNNFSYKGLKALFEYLEQYEEETGEDVMLDVVTLCVEYTEYNDMEEIHANYNKISTMEELEENTTVIKIEGTDRFIIQNF